MRHAEPCAPGSERGDDFAALFEQHRPWLRAQIGLRIGTRLRTRIDADDVVQEVFLAAQKRWAAWSVAQPVPLVVWLRSLMLQTLQGLHRFHVLTQQRSVLAEMLLAPAADSARSHLQLLAVTTSPSERAVRGETIDALRRALAGLSHADQTIISLRHFEDLTNDETACVLGITPKAASIRFFRAIERLRRALEASGCGNETDGV